MKFLIAICLNCIVLLGGELKIMTEELAPFNYKNGGELEGISVDIVKIILDKLNYKNEQIEIYPWSRGLKILESNSKAILFSTSYSKERAKKFKFACPLIPLETYFYKNRSNPINIKTLEDTKNVKSIGVVNEFFNHQELKRLGFKNIDISSKYETIILKLINNKVDLIVSTDLGFNFSRLNQIDFTQIENTGLLFYKSDLCVAFNKNFPDEEVQRWRDILKEIHNSGTFKEIYNKYLTQSR